MIDSNEDGETPARRSPTNHSETNGVQIAVPEISAELRVSNREWQVLDLASKGLTDKQISQSLAIGLGTIATYWNRIRAKLGVSSRSEMVARFVKHQSAQNFSKSADENEALRREITRREIAEKALQSALDKNSALLRAIPDLMLLLDRNSTHLEFHAHSEFDFAVDPATFQGKRFEEFLPPEMAEKFYRMLNATLATGATNRYETTLDTPDGPRHYESRMSPCGDDHVLVIVRNITAEKQMQHALVASERRLRLAVGAAKLGVWEYDLIAKSAYLSLEWKQQIGFENNEVGNDPEFWSERVHPDDLNACLASIPAFLESGNERYENRYRLLHKQGHYVWVESVAVLDESDQRRRLVGYTVDISHLASAFGVSLNVKLS